MTIIPGVRGMDLGGLSGGFHLRVRDGGRKVNNEVPPPPLAEVYCLYLEMENGWKKLDLGAA